MSTRIGPPRRASAVEPMRRLIKRLSGFPATSSSSSITPPPPKTPKLEEEDTNGVEKRSFGTWRRQRRNTRMETRQRREPEESTAGMLSTQLPLATKLRHYKPQPLPEKITAVPCILPPLRVNSTEASTIRSGIQGFRGAIRAAPLAIPEQSFLGTSGLPTPTTLAKTARRLSAPMKRIGRLSNRRRGSYTLTLTKHTGMCTSVINTNRFSVASEPNELADSIRTHQLQKSVLNQRLRKLSLPGQLLPDAHRKEEVVFLPSTDAGCTSTFSDISEVSTVPEKPTLLKLAQLSTHKPPQLNRIHPSATIVPVKFNNAPVDQSTPAPANKNQSTRPPVPTTSKTTATASRVRRSTQPTTSLQPTDTDKQAFNARNWSKRLQACINRAGSRKPVVAGITLFNIKPENGIAYLLEEGILQNNPTEIAKFLHSTDLSRQALGEYFGRISDPLAVQVVQEYVDQMDFRGKEVDEALRLMFSHFHPEGETQKIEFFMQTLKNTYLKHNPQHASSTFRDPETITVLAYSIMMLHTGFYNANARKKSKPMTCSDFIRNNRGIDDAKDLPSNLLQGIYDRVTSAEFKTMRDITDRLRDVDRVLVGPQKPDFFLERHRRFVAWVAAFEVVDVTARRPLMLRTTSQLRGIFVFNDMLVVAKPINGLRSNAVDELLGVPSSPVEAEHLDLACDSFPSYRNGSSPANATLSRRLRSLDRLVVRMTSPPTFPLVIGTPKSNTATSSRAYNKTNDTQLQGACSKKVPINGLFQFRQFIPLDELQVLVFESEYYKFGVQLRDDSKVLINLNLPNNTNRARLIDWIYGSIEETRELIRREAYKSRKPTTPVSPNYAWF